jgi:hypothetical protein
MKRSETEHKNYLMVCVEKPLVEGTFPGVAKWPTLLVRLTNVPRLNAIAQKLCDNVWLLPENERELAWAIHDLCRDQKKGLGLACHVYTIRGKLDICLR